MARTIATIRAALAAGEHLSAAETQRFDKYQERQWSSALVEMLRAGFHLGTDLRKWIRRDIETASRAELRQKIDWLLAVSELHEDFVARMSGEYHAAHRQRQRGSQEAADRRRQARAKTLAKIDEIKARHPSLSTAAAARLYLSADSAWDAMPDDEQKKRIGSLTRRLRRAPKNTGHS